MRFLIERHQAAVSRLGWGIVTGLLLLIAGCSREAAPTDSAPSAVTVVAEDTGAGLTLTVSADRAEIRTVDRLRLRTRLTRPAGLPVELVAPDWDAAGWTLVDASRPTARATGDGRIEESSTITLEPFLDGTYAVPAFEASWELNGDRRMVRTGAMEIVVDSVLTGSDGDTLASALPAVSPWQDAPGGTGLLVGAIVVALGVLIVLWRMTRTRGAEEPAERSAIEQLRSVAAGRVPAGEGMGILNRAIDRLAATVGPGAGHARLDELRARCESARFGGGGAVVGGVCDDEARAIARGALAVLEEHG